MGIVAFALGHWILADRYWTIGEKIPALESESKDAQHTNRIKCVKNTSHIMVFLFLFFPLLAGVCFVVYYLSDSPRVMSTSSVLLYVFLVIPYFMQFVTIGILYYGFRKISYEMKRLGKYVNHSIIWMYLGSYLLAVVGGILFVIAQSMNHISSQVSSLVLITNMVAADVSSLMLCVLFHSTTAASTSAKE